MNPYLIYIKIAAAAVLLAVLFGTGYHFGGMASRTALEADHAAMAQAATQALLSQRKAQDAESARINKAVSDYEKPIDPITVGLSHRVFIYANRADCPVPGAATVATGTQTAAPVPIGPSSVERSLGDYITACAEDAAQLSAVIQLAP